MDTLDSLWTISLWGLALSLVLLGLYGIVVWDNSWAAVLLLLPGFIVATGLAAVAVVLLFCLEGLWHRAALWVVDACEKSGQLRGKPSSSASWLHPAMIVLLPLAPVLIGPLLLWLDSLTRDGSGPAVAAGQGATGFRENAMSLEVPQEGRAKPPLALWSLAWLGGWIGGASLLGAMRAHRGDLVLVSLALEVFFWLAAVRLGRKVVEAIEQNLAAMQARWETPAG